MVYASTQRLTISANTAGVKHISLSSDSKSSTRNVSCYARRESQIQRKIPNMIPGPIGRKGRRAAASENPIDEYILVETLVNRYIGIQDTADSIVTRVSC